MKKIIIMLVCMVMVIGMVGCGSSSEDEGADLTSYNYKQVVEEYVTNQVGNVDYSMVNYREWDSGDDFMMVENTFELGGVEHSYLVRVGKDNMVYKFALDGETIYSADADTLFNYYEWLEAQN